MAKSNYDEYGFILTSRAIPNERPKESLANEDEWESLLINLRRIVRKGIPDSLRSTIWPLLMIKRHPKLPYKESIATSSPAYEEQIRMDVRRTYPNHEYFNENNSPGSIALTNVLKAISGALPELGYCQGINFIAAVLLLYLSEETTYLVIYNIMVEYEMAKYYSDLTWMGEYAYIFDALMLKFQKPLFHKFVDILIFIKRTLEFESMYFITNWFVPLYILTFPFSTSLRVFDNFLLDGKKTLYRVGLAIMEIKKAKFLASTESDTLLMEFANNESLQIDPDLLIKTAMSFKFGKRRIVKLERKYLKEVRSKKGNI